MDIIGKKIKELRENKGLTQKEFASLFGYKLLTVSRWERGERRPSFSDLKKLSDIFGISISYFLEEEKFLNLPLMGKVGAGKREIYFDSAERIKEIEFPLSILPERIKKRILKNKEKFFVLEVSSDSMEPLINEGDFVVIERGEYTLGDIVLLRIGSTDYLLKRLIKRKNNFFLISENKKYGILKPDEETHIIGKVIFVLSLKFFD
ncbi:MAG: XRE family transcriptional regulator [candidate division WOR-3 bacterium]